MDKPKLIYASSIASSVAILFVTVITIVAEFKAPLKDWLKSLSGHHWTSKGIISVLLYLSIVFLVYFAAKGVNSKKITGSLCGAIIMTVLGSLALFVFFAGHHLGWY